MKSCRKRDLSHQKVTSKYLARTQDGELKQLHENHSKKRPSNVTPFVLEGCWPLDGLDQATLRFLSRAAKRKRVGVADVIYESVESFVAKCEAEADLETKIIKFRRR